MRSISRVCDVSINTVSKLLIDAGKACAAFHDANVRDVKTRRVQVDEIWSFTYAKQKNVPTAKRQDLAYGDTWTWTASRDAPLARPRGSTPPFAENSEFAWTGSS